MIIAGCGSTTRPPHPAGGSIYARLGQDTTEKKIVRRSQKELKCPEVR